MIIVNSLLFIELENELQKRTKELTILKETLQLTKGGNNSFYCSAIGNLVYVECNAPVIIHHSLYCIFDGTIDV